MAVLIAGFGPLSQPGSGRLAADLEQLSPLQLWSAPCPARDATTLGVAGSGANLRVVGESGAEIATAGIGSLHDGRDVAEGMLAAYRQQGAAGLRGLRGAYAFALWDGRGRSLYVGCDAVGLQAPAYSWDGRSFFLSSRALALLRCRDAAPAWDQAYLAHALGGLWSALPDATAFAAVRRMRGGELMRVSAGGIDRLPGDHLYFDRGRSREREAAVRELGARLDRAVSASLGSHATCVSLSGGLDSSTVAATLGAFDPELDAFSLVAPPGSSGDDPAVAQFSAAFPRVRSHRVRLSGDALEPPQPLTDDPICAGPALQPGRRALLRAARDAGFRRILDGDGGDELFDLAWWSRDLIHERAFGPVLTRLASRSARSRLIAELRLSNTVPPIARAQRPRVERSLRAARPWMRDAFWNSSSFAEASGHAREYHQLRSARERLPHVLGSYARYRRAQEVTRAGLGLEAVSPLLDRGIIELVGSLDAATAMDSRHGKALLRRLAARRMPASMAWRPKHEPLNRWLEEQLLSDEAGIARAVSLIRRSPMLAGVVDPAVVLAVVQAREPLHPVLAHSLVELLTIVDWVAMVEEIYGL